MHTTSQPYLRFLCWYCADPIHTQGFWDYRQ